MHINENFAKLAEALYIADRKAREAVEMRAQMERHVAQKEKEEKEKRLKEMAKKAREERAGIHRAVERDEEVRERDDLRRDRQKERQRDRNIARAGPDKRSKHQRERERDISEKIALGLPNTGAGGSSDVQFDQRLFNQSKGLDSGFNAGEDEAYNVYDKPWRQDRDMATSIYRPSKNLDNDVYGDDLQKLIGSSSRFVPDKGFQGADRTARRQGPVPFEKDEDDPFGLEQFLSAAKQAEKRPSEDSRSGRDYDKSKRRRE